MLAFVNDLVSMCFTDDGEYVPETLDFFVKYGVLTRYANLTFPTDIEKAYAMIYHSDVFEFVVQRIDQRQLEEIVNAAANKVKFLCDANIKETRVQLSRLLTMVEEIGDKFGAVFDGLTTEDVSQLVQTLTWTGVDEGKMVEAFLAHKEKDSPVAEEVEHVGGQ